MKQIACLLLNYNDSDTTLATIQKLKAYNIVSEIVVVDNKSTDDSYERLKSIEDDKIIVIEAERNGGYGAGNNIGIKYIHDVLKRKNLMLLNPDVEISESTIENVLALMETCENCAMIAPLQRLGAPDGPVLLPWRLSSLFEAVISSSSVLSKLLRVNLAYDRDYIVQSKCVPVDVIQGALFIADTESLYQSGMYDEDLFLYNEEECLVCNH